VALKGAAKNQLLSHYGNETMKEREGWAEIVVDSRGGGKIEMGGRRARSSPKPLRCSPCVVPWSPNTKRSGHMTCIYTDQIRVSTTFFEDRELNVLLHSNFLCYIRN
jgi:hypothetical protein